MATDVSLGMGGEGGGGGGGGQQKKHALFKIGKPIKTVSCLVCFSMTSSKVLFLIIMQNNLTKI